VNSHILVCPGDINLLNRLGGKTVVIRLSDFEDVTPTIERAKHLQLDIKCIALHSDIPVSDIPFNRDWEGEPLAVFAPDLGNLRDFIKKIALLRHFNIRFYLPNDSGGCYTSHRILSSLGFSVAVLLNDDGVNWDALCDLMTYSLLGLVRHAPIEPFQYVTAQYDRNRHTDYASVYFEDPTSFLHLDGEGHVALSPDELRRGSFIGVNVDEIGDLSGNVEYVKRIESWRNFFLETNGCAYCQGWRVCLGKFAQGRKNNSSCKDFHVELMDVVEQYQTMKDKNKTVWQP